MMAGLIDIHLRQTCTIELVTGASSDGTPTYAAPVTEACRVIDSSARKLEVRVRGQTIFPRAEYLLAADTVATEEALIDGSPVVSVVADRDGLGAIRAKRAWI